MKPWISPEEAAAAIERGTGRGVRIAILDSGVEAAHPGLGALQLLDDLAIVDVDSRLEMVDGCGIDVYGHGTAVAGIIRSAAPEAEIGSFRVLGEALSARTSIVHEAAHRAIERGYHILNCSLGCCILDHVLRYKSWVDAAYLRGVHVVAACNNHDHAKPEWPGFFSSVLTVNMTRTEQADDLFHRSGTLVEFAACGVEVDVLWRDGSRKSVTGSSFAAPRVAGLVARLLSEFPSLPPLQVKTLLQRVARPWAERLTAPAQR